MSIVKVLLIHNVDPCWDKSEIKEARKYMRILDESLKNEGIETYVEEVNNSFLEQILKKYNPDDIIVFNLCESVPGVPNSEKMVAEILDYMGFTYTGNKPHVLELSYYKQKVKEILASFGVTVPFGALMTPEEAADWYLFPAIVKPSYGHCSLTLSEKSVVYDTASLQKQIRLVNNELEQLALVEEFISGREFHVSVWNNNPPEMLPPVEMDFSAFHEVRKKLCTYDSKFTPGSEHYEKIEARVPAYLDTILLKKLEREALAAFRVFGCTDYARFDFRLYNGKFYLLDINPNNDITVDTSFAMAAQIGNYSYGLMAKRIVMMAAARHPVYSRSRLLPEGESSFVTADEENDFIDTL